MMDRIDARVGGKYGLGSLIIRYSEEGYYKYLTHVFPDEPEGMKCEGLVRITPDCEVAVHGGELNCKPSG